MIVELSIEPGILDRAQLEAQLAGQTVEAVLLNWIRHGSELTLIQCHFEVWSPQVDGNAI
jgi:hypothetical protein